MLTRQFYEKFLNFDYILIYQTDAFIFVDKLDEWCTKGFSYVGAPWFKDFTPPYCTNELQFVGNGGFSLRKVPHFIKVLNTFSTIFPWSYVWKTQLGKRKNTFFRNVLVAVKRSLFGNNCFSKIKRFS